MCMQVIRTDGRKRQADFCTRSRQKQWCVRVANPSVRLVFNWWNAVCTLGVTYPVTWISTWVSTGTDPSSSCSLLCCFVYLNDSFVWGQKESDHYGLYSEIQLGLSSERWVGFWFWKEGCEKWRKLNNQRQKRQLRSDLSVSFSDLTGTDYVTVVGKLREEDTGMDYTEWAAGMKVSFNVSVKD